LELVWIVVKSCVMIFLTCIGCADWNSPDIDDFTTPDTPDASEFEPYNNIYLVLGTALLWFGWAGR